MVTGLFGLDAQSLVRIVAAGYSGSMGIPSSPTAAHDSPHGVQTIPQHDAANTLPDRQDGATHHLPDHVMESVDLKPLAIGRGDVLPAALLAR